MTARCAHPDDCDEIGGECSWDDCPFGPLRTDRVSRRQAHYYEGDSTVPTVQTFTAYLAHFQDVLDRFSWCYQDGDQTRGEVSIEDGRMMLLVVWCEDNEADAPGEGVQPLEVRQAIDFSESPEANIRNLIHGYLTHEADEQMYFDGQRIFYPH